MKKLIAVIFLILSFGTFSAQCDYTLTMIDSWGDGWNGNTIDVLVNGNPVLDNVTLASGSSGDLTFTVNTGDAITTLWNGGGSYASETSYQIKDVSGAVVGSGAISSISTPISANCPSCLPVSALNNSNTTDSSADITWTADGTETAWNLEYGASGFTQGSGSTVPLTATNYSLSGLSPNTTYDIYVQADCGTGQSSWTGPLTFTTPCTALGVPFDEGFENAGAIPSCWSMSGGENWLFNTTGPNHVGNAGTLSGATSTNSYYAVVDASGYTGNATLNSPPIDVSSLTAAELSFFLISDDEGYGFSSTLTVTANGNTVGTFSGNTTGWENKIIDLSAYTGTVQINFIFSEPSDNGAYYDDIAIDDVSIHETPSCTAPTNINSANIVSNGADISWTVGSTETAWNLEYGASGFAQGSGNTVPLTSANYTISGLTSNTNYDVYVQADCGSDQSSWTGPFSFNTSCEAISVFPHTEDFTSGNTSLNCWEVVNGGDAGTWTFTNNECRIVYGSTAHDDYLITPKWNVQAGVSDRITIDARNATVGTYEENFDILLSTTGTNPTDFTETIASNVIPPTTNQSYTFDIPTYTGQDIYIAFRNTTTDQNVLYIDNFEIKGIPACLATSGLSESNISQNSADISWTANGTETAWNLEYGASGFTQGSGSTVPLTATNYSLSGLSPNTTYDIYVQADCGTGQSSWTGPLTFTTPCTALGVPFDEGFENAGAIPSCWSMSGGENWLFNTTGPNHVGNAGTLSGATSTNSYYAVVDASGYTGNATLNSPPIDVSSLTAAELSFFLISDDEGYGFSSTLTVTANGNTVGTFSGNTTGWENKIIDLSAYTGTVQINFIFSEPSDNGAYYDDIAIDDVSIHETPSCTAPTNINSANIVSNGADISWTVGSTETAWNLEYGASGFAQGSGNTVPLTSANYTISGLTSNTNYDVYVQADCGSDQSSWTGPFSFNTSCEAISVFPHTEDFTSGNTSLNCWEVVNGGDAGTWTFTNNECRIVYGSTAHDDYLITPKWNVQAGVSDRITIDARNATVGTYEENFDILLSTTGTNPTDFTETIASNVIPPTTNQSYTFDIPTYTGQDIYIAFRNTTTDQNVLYIDNFEIKGIQINIPDDNFEAYLEANGMGDGIANNDNVSVNNIINVTTLDVSNQNISDLTGISSFTNLISLNCKNNSLTSLDITQNTALRILNCRYNQISALDLSQNTLLTTLNCSDNNLSSINISQNTALNKFSCEDNLLSNLDISNNTSLNYFICGDNQITNIDVSNNTALTYFGCHGNQLTNLDVSNNTTLEVLSFGKNQLTTIDISTNTALSVFRCYENQLSSLDLSSNTNLSEVNCSYNPMTCLNLKNGNNSNITDFKATNNPNLNCIEVDDPSWSNTNWNINNGNVGSSVTFSTNCSYPAGCF